MKVPAIPYMILVAQFAYANKMPFFRWDEMVLAIEKYNEIASKEN